MIESLKCKQTEVILLRMAKRHYLEMSTQSTHIITGEKMWIFIESNERKTEKKIVCLKNIVTISSLQSVYKIRFPFLWEISNKKQCNWSVVRVSIECGVTRPYSSLPHTFILYPQCTHMIFILYTSCHSGLCCVVLCPDSWLYDHDSVLFSLYATYVVPVFFLLRLDFTTECMSTTPGWSSKCGPDAFAYLSFLSLLEKVSGRSARGPRAMFLFYSKTY